MIIKALLILAALVLVLRVAVWALLYWIGKGDAP